MSAPPSSDLPTSVDATLDLLDSGGYVANRALGTALYLALCLRRPLFLEGEAGVGKTEIAKVLAQTLDRDLIRLQCYEGLDVSSAVYEWNFARQMLEIRMAEALDSDPEAGRQKDLVDLRSTQRGAVDPVPGAEMAGDMPSEADQRRAALEADLFSERFLIKRPILRALEPGLLGKAPVLLIDELDRTDEPFEAFLLEVLSDYQVTVPEIGTITAPEPPLVIITSNRTREIHDAIKRRCFYHWVDYPSAEREKAILARKAPEAPDDIAAQVVAFVQKIRTLDLFKNPGVAETIDWAMALTRLDRMSLDPEVVNDTLGTLLKYQDDIARIQGSEAARLLDEVKTDLAKADAGDGPPKANIGFEPVPVTKA